MPYSDAHVCEAPAGCWVVKGRGDHSCPSRGLGSGQGEQIGCPHSSLKGGSQTWGDTEGFAGGRELCVSLIHLENEANSNYCRGFSEIR